METEKTNEFKNKPYFELRSNNLKIVVWRNQKQRMKDITIYYTINITNNFFANDKWHTNNAFFIEDIPKLILMLQKTYNKVMLEK